MLVPLRLWADTSPTVHVSDIGTCLSTETVARELGSLLRHDADYSAYTLNVIVNTVEPDAWKITLTPC